MIDLSKAVSEMERMERGEIVYSATYIQELIDTPDDVVVELELSCGDCQAPLAWVECSECELAPRDDCPHCDGDNGWWDCLTCDGGGVEV